MTERTLEQLIAELVAATPAPPSGSHLPAEIAELGARLVARRQPLLDALVAKLASGTRLDPASRARLEALQELDARWQLAISAAQSEISRQIRAVRKIESSDAAASRRGRPTYLTVKV